MSNEITGDSRVRFGNWMPIKRMTLGMLTVPGWGILGVGLIIMTLLFQTGEWGAGLLVLAGALLVDALFVVRWGDPLAARTIAQRVVERVGGSSRVARGEATYNTGLFTNLPAEKLTALPGALANLEEIDGTDGRGNPYTLLYHPTGKLLVAVFACAPDGNELQTQERIDTDVSWYGAWLASHSQDTAIAGATVVADTSLRSSAPLVEKITGDIDPGAPEIARAATAEAARRLPARYSESTSWAVIAWSVDSLAGSLDEAHAEVAAKLPYHVDALREAGGGAVVPATSQMLATAARISYDPERSAEIASDELRGHRNPMRVTEAGPEYFDDGHKRVVLHDGVASMTALVLVPPRVEITESTMNALFRPTHGFLRKRAAVLYRPVSPGKTMNLVEEMGKSQSMSSTAKARITERDKSDAGKQRMLEQQVVKGAMMTRFGIVVTVTFDADARSYREAEMKLKSLLEMSSLTYRLCDWDAGPAFHVSMPLGLLPWLHETMAERVAKGLS
ncbi:MULTISPECIES: SCO6880 family protein [Bacteria]|uniref:SCO6880 family protein n=1 Tax=Bacteria TaxID=2 RepID=UPI003C7AC7AC